MISANPAGWRTTEFVRVSHHDPLHPCALLDTGHREDSAELLGYSGSMSVLKTVAQASVALAIVAPSASTFAQGRLPIAYISVQRILVEAAAARGANAELESLRKAKAQELAARKKDLDATKLELANSGGYFSATKRAELQEKGRKQETELQQATQQAQSDFQTRQRALQDALRSELNAIVSEIAAQRGIQYVLNQDAAVVLAPQGADLTTEVLERLNVAHAKRAVEKK